MILQVFTTVGASLFENYRKYRPKDIDAVYDVLKDKGNKDWEGNQNRIERLRTTVSKWAESNDNACAEIKSIIKIVKREMNNCCVRLLASDTIISRFDELIKIPQVPVDVNWAMFEKNAYVLERLEEGIMDWPQFKREHNIGEDFQACFWEEDGLAGLNAIGRIFWERFKNFIVVKVPRGFGLFSDKPGNRRQVGKAINQLYNRLMDVIDNNKMITSQEQLLDYIKGLSKQDDLRHATNPGKNLFIFKYTDVEHIRLVYRPLFRRGNLSLIVCDYLRGRDIVHDKSIYIKDFQKKWSNFSDSQIEDFDTIPIKKEKIKL